jgi:DNA-binding MarR family transcriptional regulator
MAETDRVMNKRSRILAYIFSVPDAYANDISNALDIPKNTALRLLSSLERSGMMFPADNYGKRHRKYLTLTDDGSAQAKEFFDSLRNPEKLIGYYQGIHKHLLASIPKPTGRRPKQR